MSIEETIVCILLILGFLYAMFLSYLMILIILDNMNKLYTNIKNNHYNKKEK